MAGSGVTSGSGSSVRAPARGHGGERRLTIRRSARSRIAAWRDSADQGGMRNFVRRSAPSPSPRWWLWSLRLPPPPRSPRLPPGRRSTTSRAPGAPRTPTRTASRTSPSSSSAPTRARPTPTRTASRTATRSRPPTTRSTPTPTATASRTARSTPASSPPSTARRSRSVSSRARAITATIDESCGVTAEDSSSTTAPSTRDETRLVRRRSEDPSADARPTSSDVDLGDDGADSAATSTMEEDSVLTQAQFETRAARPSSGPRSRLAASADGDHPLDRQPGALGDRLGHLHDAATCRAACRAASAA